jgi:hypothetical protein
MSGEQEAFDALCGYTLSRGDAEFIHQHVVDAFAAQHVDARTKPIKLTFALVGLYLLVEKGRTGKQVQQVHMLLGRRRNAWPKFTLPRTRGSVTVVGVMMEAEGAARDAAIYAWCKAVWDAFSDSGPLVAKLLEEHGIA